MQCACCSARADFRRFTAREMMFGWREAFDYAECAACGSLQLATVPPDLDRFYPPDYYAQDVPGTIVHHPSALRSLGARLMVGGGPVLTRRLARRYPFLHWAALAGISQGSAILDVGCGGGAWLRRLRRWGYLNLTGIDPYLREEMEVPGLRLLRRELPACNGSYDLVMMHHVLEHLRDPRRALQEVVQRLRPEGRVLLRLPLAGTPLAREYGPHWFNLDPPRHLVIPSRAGLFRLLADMGLEVLREEYDSVPHTVFYSECYRRDVAMRETLRPDRIPADAAAARRIARLNAEAQGDCGVFVAKPRSRT